MSAICGKPDTPAVSSHLVALRSREQVPSDANGECHITDITDVSKNLNKSEIRRHMRQRREALSPAQISAYSKAAAQHLMRLSVFKASKRVGIYYPYRCEINPLELDSKSRNNTKLLYLPVVMPLHFQPLMFALLSSRLCLNRFRIPEPDVSIYSMKSVRSLDLLLLPMLAFDPHGNRLGFGAGYYDKTLAYLRHRKYWRKPRLIGLAYSFQQYSKLPRDTWDIKLPMVVTEKGVVVTKAKQS